MSALVICSGGMDSVTLAHMIAETEPVRLVGFHYGQKHRISELQCAMLCARDLDAPYDTVDVSDVGHFLASALTDLSKEVPHGHYADENMKATVVPNRNMIMLSIAVGIAVAEGHDYVATGVHAGDHPIYPDCRPGFINMMSQTAQLATEGFHKPGFTVEAPFVNMSKADIVKVGSELKRPVDYSKTWSCYEGGAVHCGQCGTCVERKEAFQLAGVTDPTKYAS